MTMPQHPGDHPPGAPTSQRVQAPEVSPHQPTQGMPVPEYAGPVGYGGPQGPPAPGPSIQPPDAAGFGPSSHVGRPRPRVHNPILALAAVAVVGVVCGLSIPENNRLGWDSVNAWGVLAIAGAVVTAAPALAPDTLSVGRAWQVAVCGAGALVLFWVLFVLPVVGTNTSLAMTIGVAAGAIAAWIAPGRAASGTGGKDDSW